MELNIRPGPADVVYAKRVVTTLAVKGSVGVFYIGPTYLILDLERSRARAILHYSRLYPESVGRVFGPHLTNRQRVCYAFKGDSLLVVHTVRLAYACTFGGIDSKTKCMFSSCFLFVHTVWALRDNF